MHSTAKIATVRGPVDSAALGVTLMHEHVFVLDAEIMQNYPEEWGSEDARVQSAIDRMNELKSRGVDSLLDLTVTGLGRYIPRIERIAAQTQLNILVATGIYTYNELPFYFQFRGPKTIFGGPELIADMFVRDIEKGIGETNVRAAVLKCATDAPGLTRDVERILRATAMAHRQTGVPISTHTNARRKNGLEQQRVFKEEGVDLTRVIIGHSGDTTDLGYLEELIDNGSYIGMDRFGIDTFCPFEDRVATVATLCERGHAGRMVLSHDAACFNHWHPEREIAERLPRWNYLHIHNDVIPALEQRGVTKDQLRTMLVDNPRRIFEVQGGY
jgi:phosphotriesterase-related protein